MIVVLHHGESDDVVSCAGGRAHALHHGRAAHVGQVSMNRQVGVILELELGLLGGGDHLIGALTRVHLPSRQLLRLQPFLVAATARGLSTLALSHSVFLVFFELATIHVLGCVGRPSTDVKECC